MTTANGIVNELEAMRKARGIDLRPKPKPTLAEPLRQLVSTLSPSGPSPSSTPEEGWEAAEERRLARALHDRIRDSIRAARIPERFAADPDNTRAEWAQAATSLVAMIGTGAVVGLLGTRGAGKSHMACCAIREACRRERSGLYTTAMDIFLTVKRSFRQSATETEAELINGFCRPSFLVIDEAHERGESEWEDRMLRYVVDKRYAAMKDTVVVANLKAAELSKALGPSFADRVLDGGGVIDCNWPSFRGARQ